jgi:hypothetical protein
VTSLHHIGYWVDDLDAAMKQWAKDLDVGPFEVIEHVTFEEFTLAGTQDDIIFDHAAAFAAWGPLVVELNQVHAIDDRLAAALNPIPGTVSHVSWMVPDVTQESTRLTQMGCRLINTARSGPVQVAWHHGGPLFSHPVELHQRTDVIAGMHARLVALRSQEA